MSSKNSIVYGTFKPLVKLGAKVFFRKLELINSENIPLNKPVILVSNHQNAMMDPVMLCVLMPMQLNWLTRADLFKNPTINKLLRSINMLPVYRERDKVDDLKGVNNETFDECNARLRNGRMMCVFPEGSHRGKKQLVPLKKGVSRIAINAFNSGLEDIVILPVGLNYENFYNYRTSLLAVVGQPIEVKKIVDLSSNQVLAQNALLASIRKSLKAVMIDIEQNDIYDELSAIEPLCNKLSNSGTQYEQFSFYHKLVGIFNSDKHLHEELKLLTGPYMSTRNALKINEKYFNENSLTYSENLILLLGFFPALIAAIIFYPVYAFAEYVVKKIVKDPLFINSIRVTIWTFITPVYLLLLFIFIYLSNESPGISIVLILIFIGCGMISFDWWRIFKQLKQRRLCKKYQFEKNKQYLQLLKDREKLTNWLLQLVTNRQHV